MFSLRALPGICDELLLRNLIAPQFHPQYLRRFDDRQGARLARAASIIELMPQDQLFPAPREHLAFENSRLGFVSWRSPVLPVEEALRAEGLLKRVPAQPRRCVTSPLPEPIMTSMKEDHRAVLFIHGMYGAWLTLPRLLRRSKHPNTKRPRMVALALPGNGPRHDEGVNFPGRDPVSNLIELARVITELRELTLLLRQRGYESIGAWGVSFGAYVAALLGTVVSDIDWLMLERPLSSLTDLLKSEAWLGTTPDLEVLMQAEAVYRAVSPLKRKPLIDAARVTILAGQSDHIVPMVHAKALAKHFGTEVFPFYGSHSLCWGRAKPLRQAFGRWHSQLAPESL